MPNSEKMPEDARESDVRMEDLDIDGLRKMMEDFDIDELMQALGHSNSFVSSVAAEALGKRGGARAVEPLINMLADSEEWMREGVADIPRTSRMEAFYVIGNGRANAAEALGKIGDARAVEPLISALSDSYEAVRANAAKALGEIGDARAVEPLISALSDSDEWVREYAAIALGEIGDARAVEPLIKALGDSDEDVRESAAKALEKMG